MFFILNCSLFPSLLAGVGKLKATPLACIRHRESWASRRWLYRPLTEAIKSVATTAQETQSKTPNDVTAQVLSITWNRNISQRMQYFIFCENVTNMTSRASSTFWHTNRDICNFFQEGTGKFLWARDGKSGKYRVIEGVQYFNRLSGNEEFKILYSAENIKW